jgi:hypothetical protein
MNIGEILGMGALEAQCGIARAFVMNITIGRQNAR